MPPISDELPPLQTSTDPTQPYLLSRTVDHSGSCNAGLQSLVAVQDMWTARVPPKGAVLCYYCIFAHWHVTTGQPACVGALTIVCKESITGCNALCACLRVR